MKSADHLRPKKILLTPTIMLLMLISAISVSAGISDTTLATQKSSKSENEISLWVQYGTHRLNEFNSYIADYSIPEVKSTFGAGFELKVAVIKLPKIKLPILENEAITIDFLPAVSFETLGKKSRAYDPHRITWYINMMGVAVGPQINLGVLKKYAEISFRPRLGYYVPLGIGGHTKLNEQYVTGNISVSGSELGYALFLRYKAMSPSWFSWLLLDIGYRWLNFDDLTQEASGEWAQWYESDVPFDSDIDFSGWIFRCGASKAF